MALLQQCISWPVIFSADAPTFNFGGAVSLLAITANTNYWTTNDSETYSLLKIIADRLDVVYSPAVHTWTYDYYTNQLTLSWTGGGSQTFTYASTNSELATFLGATGNLTSTSSITFQGTSYGWWCPGTSDELRPVVRDSLDIPETQYFSSVALSGTPAGYGFFSDQYNRELTFAHLGEKAIYGTSNYTSPSGSYSKSFKTAWVNALGLGSIFRVHGDIADRTDYTSYRMQTGQKFPFQQMKAGLTRWEGTLRMRKV